MARARILPVVLAFLLQNNTSTLSFLCVAQLYRGNLEAADTVRETARSAV